MGIILCIITAVAWASADIFRKNVADSIPTEQLSLWLVLGQLPLFAIWAGYGYFNGQEMDMSMTYWQYGAVCGFLNAITILGMLLSFQMAPISLTIPLLSLTPLASAVFDMIFSNEFLTSVQWGGLCVVTVGATALGLGKNGWFKEVGAWIMIGVAIIFSLLFSLDRVAAGMVGSGMHAFVELGLTGVFLAMYLVVRRSFSSFAPPASGWNNILGAVVAMTVALGVQLYAYEVGTPVAIVEVIKRSIGIFASLYFGYRFFGEPISKGKVASAGVMTLGIAVLLLGG